MVYIPMFPIRGLAISKDSADQYYNNMKAWLQERLTVHKDYEWDRIKYTIFHKAGSSNYPTGISFTNRDDALAFKLAFGL